MTSALEKIGIASGSTLKNLLTSSTNPAQTVLAFQQENSILLPSLEPSLPLLDLHKVPRLKFHNFVVKSLRATLSSRISELSQVLKSGNSGPQNFTDINVNEIEEDAEKMRAKKYLLGVLEMSFPLINLEMIRPIVFSLIKALGILTPKRYLMKLADNKEMYSNCSIEIKQLIWQIDSSLFHNELEPLIKNVLRLRNDKLGDFDTTRNNLVFNNNYLTKKNLPMSRHGRPGAEIVQKIAKMCSSSKDLYISSIQYLRDRFRKTKCLHYCTLRSEIIMYLHEMEANNRRTDVNKSGVTLDSEKNRKVRRFESVLICDERPHRVAWCADTLLKNLGGPGGGSDMEIRKFQELKQAVDRVVEPVKFYQSKRHNSKSQADLFAEEQQKARTDLYDTFMILADPFFVNHGLLWTLIKKMHIYVPQYLNVLKQLKKQQKEQANKNDEIFDPISSDTVLNRESNGNLFRNIGNSKHSPSQTVILIIVDLLHLAMMTFEEEIVFYQENQRIYFQDKIVTQFLPLLQAATCQIYLKKFGLDLIKEFERSKIGESFSTEKNQENHAKIDSIEYSEQKMQEVNNFLKENSFSEVMPIFDIKKIRGILFQITKVICPKESGEAIDNKKQSTCVERCCILILRHFAIYCVKFSHFEVLKELMNTIFSLHNKDLGVTLAAVTVSDAFFLHYFASYLIHPANLKALENDVNIISPIFKLLTYTAPDPIPAGNSSKERKAASKSGWYDRLVQAEIVLSLVLTLNSLMSDKKTRADENNNNKNNDENKEDEPTNKIDKFLDSLIDDPLVKKRIWKKLAPPSITHATLPSGIKNNPENIMKKWDKLWLEYENSILETKGIDSLDREKLKKIKLTLKVGDKQKKNNNTSNIPTGSPQKESTNRPELKLKLNLKAAKKIDKDQLKQISQELESKEKNDDISSFDLMSSPIQSKKDKKKKKEKNKNKDKNKDKEKVKSKLKSMMEIEPIPGTPPKKSSFTTQNLTDSQPSSSPTDKPTKITIKHIKKKRSRGTAETSNSSQSSESLSSSPVKKPKKA